MYVCMYVMNLPQDFFALQTKPIRNCQWSYFFSPIQEQRVHALQSRLGASEQALAALEQTATEQMEGLTQQSSHVLDKVQRQLGLAHSQLEQLYAFIKVCFKKEQSQGSSTFSSINCKRIVYKINFRYIAYGKWPSALTFFDALFPHIFPESGRSIYVPHLSTFIFLFSRESNRLSDWQTAETLKWGNGY